jgi:peptide/nickel transport system substrate-binding protein
VERPATRARSEAELRVQVDLLPQGLNPLVTSGLWCRMMMFRTVLEPLLVVSSNGGYRPFLAAKMEILGHGARYRFKLRPGVRFHDGRPLTSADVLYTFEAAIKRMRRDRGLSLLAAELAQVAEVKAPNDETFDVILRRRNYLFPAVLAEIPILPAHRYNRRGLGNRELNRAPVGTGPFRFQEGEPRAPKATKLTLVRNPDYWGRRPDLARLTFVAVPTPARALARLRNGEIDLIPSLHPSYYPDQVKGERMRRRFRVLRIHPYRLRLLLFNTRPGPLKDRRLRVALAHLTDRQRVVREVRNTLGQVLSIPISPLSRWYDKSIHPYAYDRAAAAQLLDVAGWKRDAKGHRRRLGHPLRLKMLVSREAPLMNRVASPLKAELRTAGGELEVKVGDFGYVKSQLKRGRFDLALLGIALRPESDLSPLLAKNGRLNLGRYDNPMVNRLLELLRSTRPESNRQRYLRQLYRILHDDPPFITLYAPIELMVVSRDVKGLAVNGRRPVLAALRR